MKNMIDTYGTFVISILCVATFFSVMIYILKSPDHGINTVYKTHEIYGEYDEEIGSVVAGGIGSPLDAINGVSNVNKIEESPHFEVSGSGVDDVIRISEYLPSGYSYTESDNIYKFSSYSEVLNRFTGNGNVHPVNGDGTSIGIDDVEIIIVAYEPEMISTHNGLAVQKTFATELVDALDKFGNRIYDYENNVFIQEEQLKYTETKWHRHTASGLDACGASCEYKDINSFEINMRAPNKFKVILRYQDGAMKCENIRIFKNEVIDAYTGLAIDGKIIP